MSGDVFSELRDAVARHDEWATIETGAMLVGAARRFVQEVDMQAAVIEQKRRTITPSQEALAALLAPHSGADQ